MRCWGGEWTTRISVILLRSGCGSRVLFCLACASKVRGVCTANLEVNSTRWTELLLTAPSWELPDGWLFWLCMISFFIPVINDASRRSRSTMASRQHKITRNESLERSSLQTTEGMNHYTHSTACAHGHIYIHVSFFCCLLYISFIISIISQSIWVAHSYPYPCINITRLKTVPSFPPGPWISFKDQIIPPNQSVL